MEDDIFKKEMEKLADDFIAFVEKNTPEGNQSLLKVKREKDGIMLSTNVQSDDMNIYPFVIIFSYDTGMVYFYLSKGHSPPS